MDEDRVLTEQEKIQQQQLYVQKQREFQLKQLLLRQQQQQQLLLQQQQQQQQQQQAVQTQQNIPPSNQIKETEKQHEQLSSICQDKPRASCTKTEHVVDVPSSDDDRSDNCNTLPERSLPKHVIDVHESENRQLNSVPQAKEMNTVEGQQSEVDARQVNASNLNACNEPAVTTQMEQPAEGDQEKRQTGGQETTPNFEDRFASKDIRCRDPSPRRRSKYKPPYAKYNNNNKPTPSSSSSDSEDEPLVSQVFNAPRKFFYNLKKKVGNFLFGKKSPTHEHGDNDEDLEAGAMDTSSSDTSMESEEKEEKTAINGKSSDVDSARNQLQCEAKKHPNSEALKAFHCNRPAQGIAAALKEPKPQYVQAQTNLQQPHSNQFNEVASTRQMPAAPQNHGDVSKGGSTTAFRQPVPPSHPNPGAIPKRPLHFRIPEGRGEQKPSGKVETQTMSVTNSGSTQSARDGRLRETVTSQTAVPPQMRNTSQSQSSGVPQAPRAVPQTRAAPQQTPVPQATLQSRNATAPVKHAPQVHAAAPQTKATVSQARASEPQTAASYQAKAELPSSTALRTRPSPSATVTAQSRVTRTQVSSQTVISGNTQGQKPSTFRPVAQGKPPIAAQGTPPIAAQGKPHIAAQGNTHIAAQGKPHIAAQGKPPIAAQVTLPSVQTTARCQSQVTRTTVQTVTAPQQRSAAPANKAPQTTKAFQSPSDIAKMSSKEPKTGPVINSVAKNLTVGFTKHTPQTPNAASPKHDTAIDACHNDKNPLTNPPVVKPGVQKTANTRIVYHSPNTVKQIVHSSPSVDGSKESKGKTDTNSQPNKNDSSVASAQKPPNQQNLKTSSQSVNGTMKTVNKVNGISTSTSKEEKTPLISSVGKTKGQENGKPSDAKQLSSSTPLDETEASGEVNNAEKSPLPPQNIKDDGAKSNNKTNETENLQANGRRILKPRRRLVYKDKEMNNQSSATGNMADNASSVQAESHVYESVKPEDVELALDMAMGKAQPTKTSKKTDHTNYSTENPERTNVKAALPDLNEGATYTNSAAKKKPAKNRGKYRGGHVNFRKNINCCCEDKCNFCIPPEEWDNIVATYNRRKR